MSAAAEAPRLHPATDYAQRVAAGEIIAGRLVRRACARHLADLEREATKRFAYRFDEARANRALRFICGLSHSKGEWAGLPFYPDLWECFVIGCLFGWVRKRDGRRRFVKAFIEVARKNGKSTLAAAIALYLLVADGEAGAEVYSAATKRDQAKIVFGEAERMARATAPLRRRLKITTGAIAFPEMNATFQPLGADADTLDGLNVSAAILDEIHAHKTRKAVDVIDTATGARRQPLLVLITTAGTEDSKVWIEEHDYAEKVVLGVLKDPSIFVYIASIDRGDNWADEANWIKANPGLGVSVSLEDLRRKARRAKSLPSAQGTFRQKHLNERVSAIESWIDMDRWGQAANIAPLDPAELQGALCLATFDLSSKIDLSALCLTFPPLDPDGAWRALWRYFMPEKSIAARESKDRAPYSQWVEEKWITATPGDVIDYAFIKAQILEDRDRFGFETFGFDPWNATQIASELIDAGLEGIEIRQGHRTMGEPSKDFEAAYTAGRYQHGGNPVTTWMASNVKVRRDPNGNVMPCKRTSTRRIDGIVAGIMGIALAGLEPEGPRTVEGRMLVA